MPNLRIALIAVLIAPSLSGQNLEGFERVLIPVVTTHEFASNQAHFASTLAWYAEVPVDFFPVYDEPGDVTPEIGTFVSSPIAETVPFRLTPPSILGRILFLERERADDLWLNAMSATISCSSSRIFGGVVSRTIASPNSRSTACLSRCALWTTASPRSKWC